MVQQTNELKVSSETTNNLQKEQKIQNLQLNSFKSEFKSSIKQSQRTLIKLTKKFESNLAAITKKIEALLKHSEKADEKLKKSNTTQRTQNGDIIKLKTQVKKLSTDIQKVNVHLNTKLFSTEQEIRRYLQKDIEARHIELKDIIEKLGQFVAETRG